MNHYAFAKKMKYYTIVYVEDDLLVRKYITEFLGRYCKHVYTCSDGVEGLALYKKVQPDILLLDINLPSLNGIDIAEIVRKTDKQTRILISTAYTDKEFMLKAIELNLTRYLVKPVTSEELLSALQKSVHELEEIAHVQLAKGYIYSKKSTSIIKDGKTISLRKKEVELLEFFIAHEGEVIRYDMLEETIWKDEVMTRDAIRSQMRNLRKKIGYDLFENISGVGYKFHIEHQK